MEKLDAAGKLGVEERLRVSGEDLVYVGRAKTKALSARPRA
jgi:hypothetical protein